METPRKPNSRVSKQPNSKAPWPRQPARQHHETVQPAVLGVATGAHPPIQTNSASLSFHPSRVASSGAKKCLWLALRAPVLRLAISSLSALPSVGTPRLSSTAAARGAGAFLHIHPPLVASTIDILILVSVQDEPIYPWPGGQASNGPAISRKPRQASFELRTYAAHVGVHAIREFLLT